MVVVSDGGGSGGGVGDGVSLGVCCWVLAGLPCRAAVLLDTPALIALSLSSLSGAMCWMCE